MPSPLTRTASVAALAVLVGVLAGCGDDSPDTGESGSTPVATTTPPADEATEPTEAPETDNSGAGGDDDDTIELSVDVCTLGAAVIEEQMNPDGMGDVTSAPAESTLGFGPACDWTGPLGDDLEVNVSTYDDWVDPDSMAASVGEELAGLGDEALLASDGTVSWRRDDISVRVRPWSAQGADTVAIAEAVDADLRAAGT